MIALLPEAVWAALFGLGGGVALGLAARIGGFCTLGAIESALYAGEGRRARMWGLAIAVAMLGSFALVGAGLLPLDATLYHRVPFSPVASVLGGGIFGYGMALAGTCGFGALARCGGGDLRAFVIVLVMGVAAYATASGPLASLRVAITGATALPASGGYAALLAGPLGLPVWTVGAMLALALTGALLADARFRRDRPALGWAALVGLAIVSGWAGTAWLARAGFAPPQVVSHTYSAPMGDALLYLMTSSGGGLSFGIGSVAGVALGALVATLWQAQFRWEACEDPRELRRQIGGAALMGVGAVTAIGCTIGQGIAALSVLSFSGPLVLAAICAGAALGLRQLIEGRLVP